MSRDLRLQVFFTNQYTIRAVSNFSKFAEICTFAAQMAFFCFFFKSSKMAELWCIALNFVNKRQNIFWQQGTQNIQETPFDNNNINWFLICEIDDISKNRAESIFPYITLHHFFGKVYRICISPPGKQNIWCGRNLGHCSKVWPPWLKKNLHLGGIQS